MQAALQDIVVVRSHLNHTPTYILSLCPSFPTWKDETTLTDSSLSLACCNANSLQTKRPGQPSSRQPSSSSQQQHSFTNNGGERSNSVSPVRTRNDAAGQARPSAGSRTKSSTGRRDVSGASTGSKKKSPDTSLDVIDRLDISGLYGGGGEFLSRLVVLGARSGRLGAWGERGA